MKLRAKMDPSHKGFTALNSPERSATPKPSLSGETNENDVRQDQMDSKSQNPKKSVTKNFMSPTISAASKAAVPRKKILAERNEYLTPFGNPQKSTNFGKPQKSTNFESSNSLVYSGSFHCDRPSSQTISAYDYTSEADDDQHTSSLKPYDPLTNYLSPRPQYLRYKPNRRHEMFGLQIISSDAQKDVDEKKSVECDSDPLISPTQEGAAKLENEDIVKAEDDTNESVEEEEEEEIEEFDVEREWSLRGIQKSVECDSDPLISPTQEGAAKLENEDTVKAEDDTNDGVEEEEEEIEVEGEWSLRGIQKSVECDSDPLISPTQEGAAKLENEDKVKAEDDTNDGVEEEEEEEEEEEIEEFEVERGWSLRGILKFLLLITAIGVSTPYLSSISPIQQAIGGHRYGYYGVQKHLLGNMSINLYSGGHKMGLQKGQGQMHFLHVNQQNSYEELGTVQMVVDDEEELVESNEDNIIMLERKSGWNEDISDHGSDKRDEVQNQLLNRKTTGCKDVDTGRVELKRGDFNWPEEIAENKIIDGEEDRIDEGSDQFQSLKNSKDDAEIDQELKNVEQGSQGLKLQESSEAMSDHHAQFDTGSSFRDEKTEDLVDELEHNDTYEQLDGIIGEEAGEEMVGSGREETEEITSIREDEIHHNAENFEDISVEEAGEEMVEPKFQKDESLHEEILVSTRINDDSMSDTSVRSLDRYVELGSIPTATIGFSLLAILLAFLAYIYTSRPVKMPMEDSEPVTVPLEESGRKETPIHQVHSHAEVKHMEEKVESIVKSSAMFFSMEETVRERSYHHIQAPKVELLGELVIGQVSSSIRSSNRKASSMSEETTKAFSHEESGAHSVAPPALSNIQEIASIDSPSYGSFTTEKKILKKEGGRDAKVVTTPVRRSSRIRNRAVASSP